MNNYKIVSYTYLLQFNKDRSIYKVPHMKIKTYITSQLTALLGVKFLLIVINI